MFTVPSCFREFYRELVPEQPFAAPVFSNGRRAPRKMVAQAAPGELPDAKSFQRAAPGSFDPTSLLTSRGVAQDDRG